MRTAPLSLLASVVVLGLAAACAASGAGAPEARAARSGPPRSDGSDGNDPDGVERPPWAAPPLERVISVRDGRSGARLSLDALLERLAEADVVFLGETHLDETTHRVELALYEGLLARREGRVVLSLEMLERDVQPLLDRYLAGEVDEPTFLAGARPWSNHRTAYRPLLLAARAAGAPVVAANFPTPLRRRVAMEGAAALESLAPEERALVPEELLPSTSEYWRRVDNAIRGHAAMLGTQEPGERLTSTQSLWDNAMGEACAKALAEHPGSLVLHVNGGFHSAYWDGAVRQLRQRAPDARIATVGIVPVTSPGSAELAGVPSEDYVVLAEQRASDVNEGAFGVHVARKLPYLLDVPAAATDAARVPLLLWLPDEGLRAADDLALWRARLGEEAAILVLEPTFPETAEDLAPGGRWFRPDTFPEDVGQAQEALERAWAYVLRHFPVDPARVALAGEGSGATVAAAAAVWAGRLAARGVALEPRRFARLKDLPLPLPELRDAPPTCSLRVHVDPSDAEAAAWWSAELAEYGQVGIDAALAAPSDRPDGDPWLAETRTVAAVREALGLSPAPAPPADAPRRHVVATDPRARQWARALARRVAAEEGALVAVLEDAPAAGVSTQVATEPAPADLRARGALPEAPGPFGGTTVLVVPAAELAAWRELEAEDPLAAASRFHRLRIAARDGAPSLADVLARLLEEGRTNVLVVPAAFHAGADAVRALRDQARAFEDRMSLSWLPGLGAPARD